MTTSEHAELVDRLCTLMSAEDVRAAAPEMSVADLRRLIESCEAQRRAYHEIGFTDAATL